MWWNSIFGKKPHKKTRKATRSPGIRTLIENMQGDTVLLRKQLHSLQTTVNQHGVVIAEHTSLFEDHKVRVAKLEQLVAQPATSPPVLPTSQFSRPQPVVLPSPSQKCDIECFSPQEKRILQIFFQHPDMALSYCDIAHALTKSPNTIKNELRQIIMKADLFTKNIDANNRNRFKLKDGLKLEKYLNLG